MHRLMYLLNSNVVDLVPFQVYHGENTLPFTSHLVCNSYIWNSVRPLNKCMGV